MIPAISELVLGRAACASTTKISACGSDMLVKSVASDTSIWRVITLNPGRARMRSNSPSTNGCGESRQTASERLLVVLATEFRLTDLAMVSKRRLSCCLVEVKALQSASGLGNSGARVQFSAAKTKDSIRRSIVFTERFFARRTDSLGCNIRRNLPWDPCDSTQRPIAGDP